VAGVWPRPWLNLTGISIEAASNSPWLSRRRGGNSELTPLIKVMDRHPEIPFVAYVAVTPRNLLSVAELSRHGLSDVFVRGLGDDGKRLAETVERVCGNHLAGEFLGLVEGELAKLGPRLMRTSQAVFEQPQRFAIAADIAHLSGISTKHLQRAFQSARVGTPKKFLLAAKLIRAYALLRDCPEPVSEISARVGYSEPRIFSRLCVEVFGCPPSKLRFEPRTSEVLLRVLEWLCKPPIRRPPVSNITATDFQKPSCNHREEKPLAGAGETKQTSRRGESSM
jgi:AraC-like DNA-binding protein